MKRKPSSKDLKAALKPASSSEPDPLLVPKTFAMELKRPLGIGLTVDNFVSELYSDSANDYWQVGDALVWVDGTKVYKGVNSVRDAIKEDKETHTLIVQRMVRPTPGVVSFTIRLTGTPGLGIGLSTTNTVTDLTPGTAAAKDGRLQVRMQDLCWRTLHTDAITHPRSCMAACAKASST